MIMRLGYLPESGVPDRKLPVRFLRMVQAICIFGAHRVSASFSTFLNALIFSFAWACFGAFCANNLESELARKLDWAAERAARKALVQQIKQLLSQMTLQEKAAQLLFIDIRRVPQTAGSAGQWSWKDFVARYPVGGIILFRRNLQTKEQLQALLHDMLTDTAFVRVQVLPLLGIDEEGGAVSRLKELPGLGYPGLEPAFQLSKAPENPAGQAALRGEFLGKLLGELGFNLNMAPVADLYPSPSYKSSSSVIGQRAFSSEPAEAASMVAAFVRSMQNQGVAAVLKHFPGHGYTFGDPHSGASIYKGDMARWQNEQQALPFAAGIRAGTGFVMLGHFQMPQILDSNTPASLSPHIIGQMLRRGLGFRGVVISDSFDMQAIKSRWGSAAATLQFLQAGGDMALMPPDPVAAIEAIIAAVQSGQLSEERLDASLRRILRQKQRLGLLPESQPK